MKPFLKWAGGKASLIPQYEALGLIPKKFMGYHEPFLGGGAMFWHLASNGEVFDATLSDCNAALVNSYRNVRDNPNLMMKLLDDLGEHHCEENFYEVRGSQRPITSTRWTVEDAADFIYLNKTCFNGLYRTNAKGLFNAPFGKYKNISLYDRENILDCSRTLQDVDISLKCQSFTECDPSHDDFVFIDPPYHSNAKGFTGYSGKFDDSHQIALRDLCLKWKRSGVQLLITNADTPQVREWYRDFECHEITMRRSINCRGGERVKAVELAFV